MYIYSNYKEEEFFENKRFNDSNLPTYTDIDFIQELEIKGVEEDNIISKNEWIKLKKNLYFDNKSGKIETLRKPAVDNCPQLSKYMINGNIIPFEQFQLDSKGTILNKLKDINVSTFSSMYEYFSTGEHIGKCGITSKLCGIMFENPEFHSQGQCKMLEGTKGCTKENPSHAWIETVISGKKYIIDTSLLLVIPIELKEELGYIDLKKPMLKNELIKYSDEDDIYYEHYNILNKKCTKNKASYNKYINYIEKIKETKKDEEEQR